ncbi:MAG: 16S rRNA processing protein RimM [Bacteroidetes bacterium]|nr:16S rRNA processing protein RimM [Bacteroidota bacterium]
MITDNYFKIGYVSKTHGLKGEVTAVFENEVELPHTTTVFLLLDDSLVPYAIQSISDRGDKSFVKFDQVDTQEQASKMKGCGIYVPKATRPKLKRGQFYNDELIGFCAEDEVHGWLGSIASIQGTGLNKRMIIQYGKKEILVPVHSPLIKSINKSLRKIKLNLPEGYLDI